MTKYIFQKDFPPTGWKKGGVWDTEKEAKPYCEQINLGLMLATGIIAPVEDQARTIRAMPLGKWEDYIDDTKPLHIQGWGNNGKIDVTIPPRITLQSIIDDCKFDYVSSDITEANFPNWQPSGKKVEIVEIDHFMSTEKVLKLLDEKNLKPANLGDLLSYEKINKKGVVAALGSVRSGHVPCVGGRGDDRGLRLSTLASGWSSGCTFAAVSKDEEKDSKQMNYQRILHEARKGQIDKEKLSAILLSLLVGLCSINPGWDYERNKKLIDEL